MHRLVILATALGGCSQVFGLERPLRSDSGTQPDTGDADVIVTGDADASLPLDAAVTGPPSLLDIISEANLATGLLVALDAGDLASYDGTSQTWNNLVIGAGTSFTRGVNATASNDDPTFNGTPGARTENEYFSFDGNDLFREVTAGWGDDEFLGAAAKVTVLAVWRGPGSNTLSLLSSCACNSAQITPGVAFFRQSNTRRLAVFQEALSGNGQQVTSVANFNLDQWSFSATSMDANGGTTDVRHRLDTTVEEYPNEPMPYTTQPAETPATIGAFGSGQNQAQNNTRIAMLAVWQRALTAAELALVYDAIKAERFPSLP